MQITKKEKPNRSAYAKNDAGSETAAIALILFTMQMDKQDSNNQCCTSGNVWSQMGFWRHLKNIEIIHEDSLLSFDFEQSAVDEYVFIHNNKEYKAKMLYKDDTEMDFMLHNTKYFAKLSPCEDTYKIRINQNEFCMHRNDLLGSAELMKSGSASSADDDSNIIYAPIPGKIFKINVSEGDAVKNGDVVLVIDAMKMENNILVKRDGVVKELKVALNDMVDGNAVLLVLE
jgi:biotin carboxyl carrier protein